MAPVSRQNSYNDPLVSDVHEKDRNARVVRDAMDLSPSVTPVQGLLLASFPLMTGAYAGYRRELRNSKNLVAATTKTANATLPPPSVGPLFFAKAFGYGTILSVGGVSLLTALTFWATGSESTKELIQKCRSWTPRSRRRVEEFFGVPPLEEQWRKDEDVQATANMTENEELEYFRRRYVDNGDDN